MLHVPGVLQFPTTPVHCDPWQITVHVLLSWLHPMVATSPDLLCQAFSGVSRSAQPWTEIIILWIVCKGLKISLAIERLVTDSYLGSVLETVPWCCEHEKWFCAQLICIFAPYVWMMKKWLSLYRFLRQSSIWNISILKIWMHVSAFW